jgi:hypothetical protein
MLTDGSENLFYLTYGMLHLCRCLSGRAEHPEELMIGSLYP